jgi:DNA-binding MarR family transcriptional regulator
LTDSCIYNYDLAQYLLKVRCEGVKNEPLPSLSCACASLRRASRAVTQLYDAVLRPYGLRSTQYTLLQFLARYGRMTQSELAAALALDTTTLSRSIAPLAEEVWIAGHKGADRRETVWEIAPSGRYWLDKARPAWERAQARLRSRIDKTHWSQLFDDLTAVAEAATVARVTLPPAELVMHWLPKP